MHQNLPLFGVRGTPTSDIPLASASPASLASPDIPPASTLDISPTNPLDNTLSTRSRWHVLCDQAWDHCRYLWCEVSKRATHRLSPHGPCEPSTRLTGRARTYTTDLPKRDSTLPEAASERDQHSPHHLHRLPCHFELAPAPSSPGYNHSPQSGTLNPYLRRQPSVYASPTNKTGALRIVHAQRPLIYDQSPPVAHVDDLAFPDNLSHRTDLPRA
jgi:hypothetical protein